MAPATTTSGRIPLLERQLLLPFFVFVFVLVEALQQRGARIGRKKSNPFDRRLATECDLVRAI